MTTILVPLDGSTQAERILPYTVLLAPLLHAQIQLLRVVSDPELQLLARDRGHHYADVEVLRDEVEAYLSERAMLLRAAGLEVETAVRFGQPAEQILALAQESETAMVAMTTRADSGVRRGTIGSTADCVVNGAAIPVFVVCSACAAATPAALDRVVVPLDGSIEAEQALPLAAALAAPTQAELLLVHVVEPLHMSATASSATASRLLDELERESEAQLARAVEHLRGLHTGAITTLVTTGFAAEDIVDTAAERGADLILMASRGYSSRRNLPLSAIALKVLHAARTPLVMAPITIHSAAVGALAP
jgi:nucleotide-binding universal stress UspA family protein